MASKKASVGDRAQQFLAAIGTAGGAIGAPGLVSFGAGDLTRQLQSGIIDEYAAIRAASAPQVGNPNAVAPRMSQDLDAAYIKLNLPGSPLPRNGMMTPQFLDAAEFTQDAIIANEQLMMSQNIPFRGQLPMGMLMNVPKKKGGR